MGNDLSSIVTQAIHEYELERKKRLALEKKMHFREGPNKRRVRTIPEGFKGIYDVYNREKSIHDVYIPGRVYTQTDLLF